MVELTKATEEIEARLLANPNFASALAALCLTLGAMGERMSAEAAYTQLLETTVADAMEIGEVRYLAASSLALAGASE